MCYQGVVSRVGRKVKSLFLCCLTVLTQISAFAVGSVNLAWDASTDASVTGYKVYYGVASGAYTNSVTLGNVTTTTLNGLTDGVKYYFAATARTSAGIESDLSNETSYTVPGAGGGGNNAPTLNTIANVTINEDASQQTVNLSGISAGTGESQTLTVIASSSNTGLIPTPTVTYTSPGATGSVRFTPAANANGSATITVTVNDGQATNNTISRSFTVTVNAVNDTPTLNTIANVSVAEDAPQQTVNLSGIGSGAANESQTLAVTASSSNTGLIPTPTITYTSPNATGTLRFTPVANASGSATITVTVNDGQAANNTVSRTFTVNVNSANDAPTISTIADQTIGSGGASSPIAFTVSDTETAANALTLAGFSANTNLLPLAGIALGGSGNNRTVTLTPAAGQSGETDVIITVGDGSTTASSTFHLSVTNAPSSPNQILVTSDTGGTISPNLSATPLVIGKTYSMTAKPVAGYEFAGWHGSFHSMNPKLSFVMTSNLVLEADFVPSPYVPAAGYYNGLFFEEEAVALQSAGCFKIIVTTRGYYSGSLQLGKSRYSFSGKLDLSLHGSASITRKLMTPLLVDFQFGTNSNLGEITGTVSDGAWTADLSGARSPFNSKLNPAPQTGNYTLVIPGSDDSVNQPRGHSYGYTSVRANGMVMFAGTLADGTRISQSAYVTQDAAWPFYLSLYKGAGAMTSWLTFQNDSESDINGSLSWIKATNTIAKYYPTAFTNETKAIGSTYVAPVAPAVILDMVNGAVNFAGGNLPANFGNLVTMGLNSKITNLSTNAMTLSFSTSRGTFAGKVTDPSTGNSYAFGGVAFQKLNVGYGSMLGTNLSSEVSIVPQGVLMTSLP